MLEIRKQHSFDLMWKWLAWADSIPSSKEEFVVRRLGHCFEQFVQTYLMLFIEPCG
jgi:hypothetical protein